MTKINVTLDDTSPLLTYTGNWTVSGADEYSANYQGFGASTGTRHGAPTQGLSVELDYVGSRVWVYGAKRKDHGGLTVQVDGESPEQYTGYSASDEYQALLNTDTDYSKLAQGSHKIVVTNTYTNSLQPWLDIDWVTFETEVGGDGANLTNSTIDLSSSSLSWTPAVGSWASAGSDGKSKSIMQPAATVKAVFSGDAIYVLGGVNANHAPMLITVDGQSYNLPAPSASLYVPNSLLFFVTGLSDGSHALSVTHSGTNSETLELGSFVVVSDGKNASSGGGGGGGSGDGGSSHTGISTAAIGGIAGGLGAGLLLLLLLVFLLRRQRRQRHHNAGVRAWDGPRNPVLDEPYTQGPIHARSSAGPQVYASQGAVAGQMHSPYSDYSSGFTPSSSNLGDPRAQSGASGLTQAPSRPFHSPYPAATDYPNPQTPWSSADNSAAPLMAPHRPYASGTSSDAGATSSSSSRQESGAIMSEPRHEKAPLPVRDGDAGPAMDSAAPPPAYEQAMSNAP